MIRSLGWPEVPSALPAQPLLLPALVSSVWSWSSCAVTPGTSTPDPGGFVSQEPSRQPRALTQGSPWVWRLMLRNHVWFCDCKVMISVFPFLFWSFSPMTFPPEAAPKEVLSHRDTLRKSHCAREGYLASLYILIFYFYFSMHNGP